MTAAQPAALPAACTAFLLATTLAHAAAPLPDLAGRWEGTETPNEFLTHRVSVSFLPDGRFVTRWAIGDAAANEVAGSYVATATTLTTTPRGAAAVTYQLRVDGDVLTLRGGDLEGLMLQSLTLRRVPGSQKTVADEARTRDAAKTREDETWRQRIPLGKVRPGPSTAPPDVPADGQPRRIFDNATVFAGGATYAHWNVVQRWTLRDRPAPNGGYSGINWHFLGNGRVLFESVMFVGSGVPGSATRVDQTHFWGRYRVDGDNVVVETDAGETRQLPLLDGRRNLRFGDTLYGHLAWEKAALDGR